MKNILIMIIEDNQDIREMISINLINNNYKTIETENRNAAFELIKSGVIPDIIMMDVMMHGMSLNEFMVRLQEQTTKVIPIILCTCSPEGERLADDLGVYFLPKAFQTKDLLRTIELCIK